MAVTVCHNWPSKDIRQVQTISIPFTIYFSNKDEFANAASIVNQQNFGSMGPLQAAGLFGMVDGVNYNRTDGTISTDKGMYPSGAYPNGYSLTVPGDIIVPPTGASGPSIRMSAACDQVEVNTPSNRNFKYLYIWVAQIQFANFAIDPDVPEIPTVGSRRWINGWEMPSMGDAALITSGINRDSSRTPDGLGWGLRSNSNVNILRTLALYQTGFTTHSSWERFYIRIRQVGAISIDIWATRGSATSQSGIRLYLNTSGAIEVYNYSNSVPGTLIGTSSALAVNTWYKIDSLPQFNNGVVLEGHYQLYINGGLEVDVPHILPASSGLGQNQFHTSTLIGTEQAASNSWEIDFDDWINAAIPLDADGNISLTTPDWLSGTHIQRTGIESASLGSFVGDTETLNQTYNPQSALNTVHSAVPGDSIIALADGTTAQQYTGTILHGMSALVSKYGLISGSTTSTTTAQLGYALSGGSPVMVSVTDATSAGTVETLYAGATTDGVPNAFLPIEAIYTRSSASNTSTVGAIGVVVEFCGQWGTEDSGSATQRVNLIHNAWYPGISAISVQPAGGGYTVNVSGTYTGTGAQQFIELPAPCHFLMVRTSPSGIPVTWFSSGMGGIVNGSHGVNASDIIRVVIDTTTGTPYFSVSGNTLNVLGTTYQYVAFCDPYMQYNLCGAFMHATSNLAASNDLPLTTFSPLACFFQEDDLTTGGGGNGLVFKGIGHTGSDATSVIGTNFTNTLTLSSGLIVSSTNAHFGSNPTRFSAWRVGNNCDDCEVQIITYTGDGTGNRVLTLTPESGRYPLFAYVQPHGSAGFFKDPTYGLTAFSQQMGAGSTSSTAIIAGGPDLLGVGSTLNANGVIYEVFVLPGSPTPNLANNWSDDGVYEGAFCIPDQPSPPAEPPPGGPGLPPPGTIIPPIVPPVVDTDINIFGNGGLELGETTPITLLKDVSGIYTIIEGKLNDTLYDRQTGQSSVDVAIPFPSFETGYIGG